MGAAENEANLRDAHELAAVRAGHREADDEPVGVAVHFRDGKCVERWSNADMLGWLVQLGAVEPPAG